MKTNISIRFLLSTILVMVILVIMGQYNPFQKETTPAQKTQPVFSKKPIPSIDPSSKDSILPQLTPRPQEQSVKKIDIKILKRFLYLHRKPQVV